MAEGARSLCIMMLKLSSEGIDVLRDKGLIKQVLVSLGLSRQRAVGGGMWVGWFQVSDLAPRPWAPQPSCQPLVSHDTFTLERNREREVERERCKIKITLPAIYYCCSSQHYEVRKHQNTLQHTISHLSVRRAYPTLIRSGWMIRFLGQPQSGVSSIWAI